MKKTIEVCESCLGEEFNLLENGITECKNCKTRYEYDIKLKKWVAILSAPDQKGFINETTS